MDNIFCLFFLEETWIYFNGSASAGFPQNGSISITLYSLARKQTHTYDVTICWIWGPIEIIRNAMLNIDIN